jgi:hypothetical protein
MITIWRGTAAECRGEPDCRVAVCDQSSSAGTKLNLRLLRQLQGVLNLDAEITNRALELSVT